MLRASPSARSGAVCRTRRVAMQASASAEAPGSQQPHRLHYFAGRGRAEQARWMLAATETRFVNAVLRSAAEFQALDDGGALLFGQVPLLQCPDGMHVVQSQAIVRHVASQAGLLGGSATERALADQLAEGVADFRGPLLSFPFGRDRGACVAAVRRYAPVFERTLRGAPAGHVAGGAAHTYADVLLAEAVTGYTELLGDFTREAFPLLGAHRDRVCKLPGAQGAQVGCTRAADAHAHAAAAQAWRRILRRSCAFRRRTALWLTRTAPTCAPCSAEPERRSCCCEPASMQYTWRSRVRPPKPCDKPRKRMCLRRHVTARVCVSWRERARANVALQTRAHALHPASAAASHRGARACLPRRTRAVTRRSGLAAAWRRLAPLAMSRVTRGLYRALFRALHACEKEHVPLSTWRDELLSLSPGGGRAPHLEALAPGAMSGGSDVQEVRAALRAAFRTPLRGAADEGAALDAALGALRALGLRRKTHVSGVTVATSTSCSRQSHGITCAVKSRFVSPFAGLEPGAPRLPFDELLYEFAYEVTFTNNGTHPVQLATRHWAITTHHDDGTHTTQHVRGAGVVGRHPKLLVGETFKYQSFCVLKAPRGCACPRHG